MIVDYVEITGVPTAVYEFYAKVSKRSLFFRFLNPSVEVGHIYSYMWEKGCKTFAAYIDNIFVAVVDISPGGECAEVGIVVADEFQRRGYGAAIASDFIKRLKKMGIRCVEAYTLPDNYPALRIARRLGAEIFCVDVCRIKLVL